MVPLKTLFLPRMQRKVIKTAKGVTTVDLSACLVLVVIAMPPFAFCRFDSDCSYVSSDLVLSSSFAPSVPACSCSKTLEYVLNEFQGRVARTIFDCTVSR